MLHLVHQGIGCVLVAALICDHLECKYPDVTLKDMDSLLSKEIYKHYKCWCRNKGQLATPCSHRFSCARFGKDTWASPPELGSIYKAAVVKSMMYWCADYLKEHDAEVLGGQLRVHCMHSFVSFQNVLDVSGPFFQDGAKERAVKLGRKALLLYQRLASLDSGRTDGRKTYKIIPKFHSFLELTFYINESNRNPR